MWTMLTELEVDDDVSVEAQIFPESLLNQSVDKLWK